MDACLPQVLHCKMSVLFSGLSVLPISPSFIFLVTSLTPPKITSLRGKATPWLWLLSRSWLPFSGQPLSRVSQQGAGAQLSPGKAAYLGVQVQKQLGSEAPDGQSFSQERLWATDRAPPLPDLVPSSLLPNSIALAYVCLSCINNFAENGKKHLTHRYSEFLRFA